MAEFRERRYLNDRRSVDRANDLHRRLEEKRQQIERRKIVRRQSDRDTSIRQDRRSEAADNKPTSDSRREERPASD
jgi:hypothetical protein